MDENKKLEFRGSSFMALVPFAIFIVITIALSFFNAADTNMMIGAGVASCNSLELSCMYVHKRVFRTIISILWLCYRCRFWYGMCTGLFTRWNSRNDGSYIE